MAWRVIAEFWASRDIDWGDPLANFSIRASRASAPKAAKSEARALRAVRRLRTVLDIALDIGHLRGPTLVIHPEGFEPAVFGKGVKS